MTQKDVIVKMLINRAFRKIASFELKRWSEQFFPELNNGKGGSIGCEDKRMRELCEMSNLSDYGYPDLWIHSRKMTDKEMAIYGCSKRVQIYEILEVNNHIHRVVFTELYIKESEVV